MGRVVAAATLAPGRVTGAGPLALLSCAHGGAWSAWSAGGEAGRGRLLLGRVAVGSAVARARLAKPDTQWGGRVAPEGRHELRARATKGHGALVDWRELRPGEGELASQQLAGGRG